MKYLQIFILLCMGCVAQSKTNLISVVLTPDKLMLEQRQIDKINFEEELSAVVALKLKEGFKKEALIINLKVDKNTRRGDIADIEVVLRRLNVRKVIYATLDTEQISRVNL